jgi:hypothetical protein
MIMMIMMITIIIFERCIPLSSLKFQVFFTLHHGRWGQLVALLMVTGQWKCSLKSLKSLLHQWYPRPPLR